MEHRVEKAQYLWRGARLPPACHVTNVDRVKETESGCKQGYPCCSKLTGTRISWDDTSYVSNRGRASSLCNITLTSTVHKLAGLQRIVLYNAMKRYRSPSYGALRRPVGSGIGQ
eukprot:1139044-Pelagomonas_calceolata.AAC.14